MGYKLTFAYDNRGNLTDVVDRDNGTTHYVYDDDSRMMSVTNPFDETTGYVYSPGGRVDRRLLANGCVTYYGYDEVGQVNLVDNRHADLSVISSFAYERDARGNPTRITREDGSVVEYGYDAKSQLTSEVHKDPLGATTDAWEWDYDLSGNRTYQIHDAVRTDYTYNLANQLTQETTAGVTTYYAYDRCGNTKSKQEQSGTTHYHWDPENRLTQIDQPGNVHSYFSYDADGKRVTKQDADGFTQFIYQGPDMLKLLQERDADGNVTAHYTMGDGLESMHRGADSRFYHYDWLGSTFELTDDTGLVTDSYLYDAWGNALAATGATPNPHRYVGRLRYYQMVGAGLHLLGLRYYSPSAAAFMTEDPLLAGGNVQALKWMAGNGRRYVRGRPTLLTDPTGLSDEITQCMALLAQREGWADYDEFAFSAKGNAVSQNMTVRWSYGLLDDPLKCIVWIRETDRCTCQGSGRGYLSLGPNFLIYKPHWGSGRRSSVPSNGCFYITENPTRMGAPQTSLIPNWADIVGDLFYMWPSGAKAGGTNDYIQTFGTFAGSVHDCKCTPQQTYLRATTYTDRSTRRWTYGGGRWKENR